MRGGVQLTIAVEVVIFIAFHLHFGAALRCDRMPEGLTVPRSQADGRFILKISGNPTMYVPGEVYTVSLEGLHTGMVPNKFTGFVLAVQPEGNDLVRETYSPSVGQFQLFGDALTKYSERCPNAVTHTSSIPKTDVQVMWTAPPVNSGCVEVKATVIEHRDLWYMDDGPLSRVLCEDVQESQDFQSIVEPCCACDEAKYEMTFEGLWSRHTHPKDFPTNGWLTRFSDVIGASHTADYRFWEYGQSASEGLRQVAEHGATRMLESELKAESEHIRTIIKARGISYPNVTGKTFAVFRVDSKHHLISLVSMIHPSPDWIVGVSGLELCLRNCSWVESKVLNLYPWDAGTDSGPTYISPDQPTTPRDVIRRIKSNYPNDPRSPFYDPTGEEMKPMARLYLSRQRLYEKACDSTNMFLPESSAEDNDGPCGVTDWEPWSSCSTNCGRGYKHRKRAYKNKMLAEIRNCNRRLIDQAICWGTSRYCQDNEQNSEIENNPMCEMTEWSKWSSCSASCGLGTRTRDRQYKHRNALKYCAGGRLNAPPLQQNDACIGEKAECDENEQEVLEKEGCEMTPWTHWSPCSATCGKGLKMRSRYPAAANNEQRLMLRMHISKKHMRYSRSRNSYFQEDGVDLDDIDGAEEDSSEDLCANVKRTEEVVCEADIPTCDITDEMAREICNLPQVFGGCHSSFERWYYNPATNECEQFNYSGCQGNRNNFATQENCIEVCVNNGDKNHSNSASKEKKNTESEPSSILTYNMLMQDEASKDIFGGLQPGNQIFTSLPNSHHLNGGNIYTGYYHNTVNSNDDGYDSDGSVIQVPSRKVVDCVVSRWSPWSPCNTTCGKGVKTRERTIQVHPRNGGKPCPSKLLKRRKCRSRVSCTGQEKPDSLNPSWGPANKPDTIRVDCILSDWSLWSPCSRTCGLNAVQQRTRRILVNPTGGGMPCGHRLEEQSCNLLPCPI